MLFLQKYKAGTTCSNKRKLLVEEMVFSELVTFRGFEASYEQISKLNIMKTQMNTRKMIFFILFSLLTIQSIAQTNGQLTRKEFPLSGFTGIEAGGAIRISFTQAEQYAVFFETDENLINKIEMKVTDGVLRISAGTTRNASRLHAVVACPELKTINLSGAATFNADGIVQAENLELTAGGASKIEAAVDVQNHLTTKLSGAAKIILYGNAVSHEAYLSGASKLVAQGLETTATFVDASGVSEARITADTLEQHISGMAKVTNTLGDQNEKNEREAKRQQTTDSVTVNLGKVKVKVLDGDSTVVIVGSRKVVVDENGNVNVSKEQKPKKRKFNGHWAGFELGINGLVTPDFSMDYGRGYEFLDQRVEKSINVNLNFFEQNISFNQKGNVGLVSGLGLSWNNYRFANDVMLKNENNKLVGYYLDGISVKKSKLVNSYLTLPMFIEFQMGPEKNKGKVHLAFGVIGGWRFSSHTKIYYLEQNKVFRLIDPISNEVVREMQSPATNKRNIVKEFDSFQQSPFKLDASLRAGWGVVNLFATYSITPMFIKNRGPELYPYSIGITIGDW